VLFAITARQRYRPADYARFAIPAFAKLAVFMALDTVLERLEVFTLQGDE
jgi:hypothetical protein